MRHRKPGAVVELAGSPVLALRRHCSRHPCPVAPRRQEKTVRYHRETRKAGTGFAESGEQEHVDPAGQLSQVEGKDVGPWGHQGARGREWLAVQERLDAPRRVHHHHDRYTAPGVVPSEHDAAAPRWNLTMPVFLERQAGRLLRKARQRIEPEVVVLHAIRIQQSTPGTIRSSPAIVKTTPDHEHDETRGYGLPVSRWVARSSLTAGDVVPR